MVRFRLVRTVTDLTLSRLASFHRTRPVNRCSTCSSMTPPAIPTRSEPRISEDSCDRFEAVRSLPDPSPHTLNALSLTFRTSPLPASSTASRKDLLLQATFDTGEEAQVGVCAFDAYLLLSPPRLVTFPFVHHRLCSPCPPHSASILPLLYHRLAPRVCCLISRPLSRFLPIGLPRIRICLSTISFPIRVLRCHTARNDTCPGSRVSSART